MPSDDPIIIGEGTEAKASKPIPFVVPHWRDIFKRFSFWLGLIGTALMSWVTNSPETVIQVWVAFPDDLKAVLPPLFVKWFGQALLVMSIVAMFIKQRRLSA